MGNNAGDFQVGEADVFPIAPLPAILCKLIRCSIAEAAMWPLFVVLRFPARDLASSVEQVGEPTHAQTLLA